MGVLLRSDMIGYSHPSPSAKKGGIAVPSKGHRYRILFFFYNVLCIYYINQHHISKNWRPIQTSYISGLSHSRITSPKGQLISKAIYGLLTSSKKRNGGICFVCFFTLQSKQIEFIRLFFWENIRLANLLFDFI